MKKFVPLKKLPDDFDASTDTESVDEKVARTKQIQKEQAKLLNSWIEQNVDFDINKYSKQWETSTNKQANDIFNIMFSVYTIPDAILKTNEQFMYGLSMSEAGIDLGEVFPFINRFAKIALVNYLMQHVFKFPEQQQHILRERIIAQQFPYKDNLPKPEKSVQQLQPQPQRFIKESSNDG